MTPEGLDAWSLKISIDFGEFAFSFSLYLMVGLGIFPALEVTMRATFRATFRGTRLRHDTRRIWMKIEQCEMQCCSSRIRLYFGILQSLLHAYIKHKEKCSSGHETPRGLSAF